MTENKDRYPGTDSEPTVPEPHTVGVAAGHSRSRRGTVIGLTLAATVFGAGVATAIPALAAGSTDDTSSTSTSTSGESSTTDSGAPTGASGLMVLPGAGSSTTEEGTAPSGSGDCPAPSG